MDGSDNKNKSNFAKQTASASGSKKIAFSRTDKVSNPFRIINIFFFKYLNKSNVLPGFKCLRELQKLQREVLNHG